MKAALVLTNLGTLIVLGISIPLWMKLSEAKQENERLRGLVETRSTPLAVAAREEPVELGEVMSSLQRYANKLYFSGRNQNWPLAGFYVEELEETVEGLAQKNVVKGQMNVSALMRGLLLPEIAKIKTIAAAGDITAFQHRYQAMTAACNSCHVASGHPFIVIQDPRTPAADNQRYEALQAGETASLPSR